MENLYVQETASFVDFVVTGKSFVLKCEIRDVAKSL